MRLDQMPVSDPRQTSGGERMGGGRRRKGRERKREEKKKKVIIVITFKSKRFIVGSDSIDHPSPSKFQ